MPVKGTKKVRAHTRQKTIAKVGNLTIKDPFSKTQVKQHFRKTRK